jgi:hypothetical protein
VCAGAEEEHHPSRGARAEARDRTTPGIRAKLSAVTTAAPRTAPPETPRMKGSRRVAEKRLKVTPALASAAPTSAGRDRGQPDVEQNRARGRIAGDERAMTPAR